MTYEFEFAKREHVRACRVIHRCAIRNRVMRRALQVGLWVFAVVVVINMTADLRRGSYPAMLPVLIAILGLVAIPTLNGYFAARQWERLNPIGHRRINFALDNVGFRTSSFPGSLEIRWEAVKQVVETSEFLLFYVTSQGAHYLPKRAVAESDLPALRDLVRSRVAPEHVHLFGEGGCGLTAVQPTSGTEARGDSKRS